MKTDDLISLLATGAAPVPTHSVGRRFALALGLGIVGAVLGTRCGVQHWHSFTFRRVLAGVLWIAAGKLILTGQ